MRSFHAHRGRAHTILAAAVFGSVMATAACATPVFVATNTDFSVTPTTISLGGGAATYTFAYLGSDPNDTTYTVDSVMTGGTALVNSSSFPGPGQQPIPFQIDSLIGDNGYDTFTAFPAAAGIAYSLATDFIGLKFTLADGDHFGYAEVLGPTLIGYGYDDAPGTPIAAVDVNSAVPEPGTLALFIAGIMLVAGVGMTRRKSDRDHAIFHMPELCL